jgi:hypothetical protein
VRAVNAEGVPCLSGTCGEIYLEQAFAAHGWRPAERLPVARALGETSLALLVHPTLAPADMDDAAQALEKVLRVACA